MRPRGKAGLKPRHPNPTGACTMSRCPKGGGIWVGAMPISRACRARPSAGRQARDAWPNGENPEITRKAVFSEGRTPCVRVERPRECRGIPFPPDDEARGRLPYPAHASVKPVPSLRPCGRQGISFPRVG